MKVLLVSTAATGHLNPLLGIGRILIAEGHEVAALSAEFLRHRVEDIQAQFLPFPAAAVRDPRTIDEWFPELKTTPPGPRLLRFGLQRGFVDPAPAQADAIRQVLQNFPADIIIGDHLMLGVLPMLLGPRAERPSVVLLGTTYLLARRDDGAPNDAGIPFANGPTQQKEYAALYKEQEEAAFEPIGRHLNDALARMGLGPLSMNLFDAVLTLPDAYLQLTVPSFEFPRRALPPSVHFVGPLPIVSNQAPLPSWAHELDGSRKVILVTQGTLTNFNFNELVVPTLGALANEPDLLVVATAGGRSSGDIPGPIPGNARVADYLPFDWMLPKTDVLVTNGGYGSVNQALSFGVPIVTAGLAADRGDVNARIAWSGVGINLATDEPTQDALRAAVRTVLDRPDYRSRALSMAREMEKIDTRSEILRIVEQIV
jgi:UDP:flavonoid glycosyltransferase YjiC (YdhE family)